MSTRRPTTQQTGYAIEGGRGAFHVPAGNWTTGVEDRNARAWLIVVVPDAFNGWGLFYEGAAGTPPAELAAAMLGAYVFERTAGGVTLATTLAPGAAGGGDPVASAGPTGTASVSGTATPTSPSSASATAVPGAAATGTPSASPAPVGALGTQTMALQGGNGSATTGGAGAASLAPLGALLAASAAGVAALVLAA